MNLENYQFRGISYTQGKKEGKVEGLLEGEAQLLLRQLRRKFGQLPEGVEARVREAVEDELLSWGSVC